MRAPSANRGGNASGELKFHGPGQSMDQSSQRTRTVNGPEQLTAQSSQRTGTVNGPEQSRYRLFHVRQHCVGPCRAERPAYQRMFGDPADRAPDQPRGAVGKVEPGLGHEKEACLVGAIRGSVGEVETGGGEASIIVYFAHGVGVPNSSAGQG